jgi:Transposase IS4
LTSESTQSFLPSPDDAGSGHGTKVLANLVKPWANTDRVVVADSYFASLQAAKRLMSMGLRFIGVVKTATRGYPMSYLSNVQLDGGKGDRKGLLHTDPVTGKKYLAFVWVDRDRRCFIASCSSLAPAEAIQRKRWRQKDKSPNAPPERMDIVIDQPEASSTYYKGCSMIDRHNRTKTELMLEKKVHTMSWAKRCNQTIFGMLVVDAYLLRRGCHGNKHSPGGSRKFFELLAVDLIDNSYDMRSLRKRKQENVDASVDGPTPDVPESSKHLTCPTPTKRYKKKHPGHRLQGRCMVCRKSTVHVCRSCQDIVGAVHKRQYWICDKAGKACMGMHLTDKHPYLIAE